MKAHSHFVVATVVLAILFSPWPANSHTPYQPTVIFYHEDFPDRPITEFGKGRLGIVQADWSRGYLIVAYRYLTGKPLTTPELKSFLSTRTLHPRTALRPVRPDSWKSYEPDNNAPQQWVRARSQFRKGKPPLPDRDDDWWEYSEGDDCLADSFKTAIRTLHDRSKRYGPSSPQLQDWITAQDQVYENCPHLYGRRSTKGVIPAELPGNAAALALADRKYQIAAAHFYAGDIEEAIRKFEAIARDHDSPWHELGAYVAARAVLRQAAQDDLSLQFDPKALEQADVRLEATAREIQSPSLRRNIAGLRQFIALRLHPDEQMTTLAKRVTNNAGDRFGQDMIDLGFLIDNKVGNAPDFPNVQEWSKEYESKLEAWHDKRYVEIRNDRLKNDIVDWLITLESDSPSATAHARERWSKTRSLPWLIAGLFSARGTDSKSELLIQAAAGIPPSSPAYSTVSYHRARLLRERGDDASARNVLKEALRHSADWPTSAINLFAAQRLLVADSLDTLVSLLPRTPIGFSNGSITRGESEYCAADSGWDVACEKRIFESDNPTRLLPQFDLESATLLNKGLPLQLLVKVAKADSLPENLRRELVPSVWARALVLGRPRDAHSLADTVSVVRPELNDYVARYEAARTDDERGFLAAYAIAHFPGLRPAVNASAPRVTRFDYADNYRDNWWCKNGLPIEFEEWPGYESKAVPLPVLPLLSAEERAQAAAELTQIAALSAGGDWLSDTLIAWAKSHPDDERSPEALYFAWRAARYGCDVKKNRSREIYIQLHKYYPSSVWAKKTRVWW